MIKNDGSNKIQGESNFKEEKKKENYVSYFDEKIDLLYNRENNDEEISDIINLIKLEDNNDFYKAFEKQISYFLESKDDFNYFDFKYQGKFNIIEFFINYIKASGLSIYDINKKEKPKKNEYRKIENKTNIKETKQKNVKNIRAKSFINNKERTKYRLNNLVDNIIKNKSNIQKINNISHNSSKSSLKISYSKSNIANNNESKSFEINSKLFFSFSEKSDFNISSELIKKKEEDKKEDSNNKINVNIEKDKQNNINNENIKNKKSLNNTKKSNNLIDASKKKNESIKKEKVIKEIGLSNDEKKDKNLIKFYDEISGLEGAIFESDTIKFIFNRLLSISNDKKYSLIYDFKLKKEELNKIFNENKLFPIDDIQMDFAILNLKISDLIKLLIDIFPLIHSNSKINLDIKGKNIITLDDLYKLDNIKKDSDERIDIIGEIGINIFNEPEKCHQLIKYTKLIHNINKMIINNSKQLQYILDLLHFTGENKKLLLFITDSSYLNFKNNTNNNFLKIQNILNVDSLLLYRNKNLLFRTKLLQTLFKKFKKEEKINFNKSLYNEFDNIIKNIFKSNIYEGVVRKLSKIEKKIFNIKNDLYNYVINNNNFKKVCTDIMEIIENNDMIVISKEKYNEIKDKIFKNVIKFKIEPEAKIYIIYEEKNEKIESIIKTLENKKIPFKDGDSFEILNDKKFDIYKMILFFISPNFLFDNFQQFINLTESFRINKLNQCILFLNNKRMENEFIKYQNFIKFNFKYVYDINKLENMIIELYGNIKQNDLYKQHIQLIENELFYKFIIDKYLYLFNKSIYSKKKNYMQNELLFMKISQDLQFLKNFEFDENISLVQEIKDKINDVNNNKGIIKIINDFIDYSKIILDIKNILIEFENNIGNKIKINRENINNGKTDIENKIDDKINQTSFKNINKNEKNENIDNGAKTTNNDEYFDMKEKKYINFNSDQDLNNLAKNVNKCTEILKNKINTEKEKEKIIDDNFILLISQIEENLKLKIKDELKIILYLNLQKSIIHKFEKEFIKNYL